MKSIIGCHNRDVFHEIFVFGVNHSVVSMLARLRPFSEVFLFPLASSLTRIQGNVGVLLHVPCWIVRLGLIILDAGTFNFSSTISLTQNASARDSRGLMSKVSDLEARFVVLDDKAG